MVAGRSTLGFRPDTPRGRPIVIERYSGAAMEYIVRQARTRDVPEIRGLIDQNVGSRRLLDKHTVNLYEDILEFTVAEASTDASVVGCGALHVMWDDLAELRTVAVDERRRGAGVGHLIVDELLDRARAVGVSRVFVLTFAVSFFASHGFTEISGTPVAPEVYAELLRSYDDGVAEFLDLDRVKPNTLGNTRMLLRLLWVSSDLRWTAAPSLSDPARDLRAAAGVHAGTVPIAGTSPVVSGRRLCPRRMRLTATDHIGRGNLHAAGSRRTCAAGDCLRCLSGRRVGTRAQRTSAKAPSARASQSGRGRTGSRARRSRAGRKLTFRDICDLSSHSDQGMRNAREIAHILARVRVICRVCACRSIRHAADTKRELSLACTVGGITSRGYLVHTRYAPRNCVRQDVGISLATENGCSAEGLKLHGAEGTGATGRRHRR
jgi:amino-acid N-acetyltransferase